jgi:hypothetical protein
LLAAYRAENSTFGLVLLDPATGEHLATLFDDPEWHDVDAHVVAPRPEPASRIPMLEFASVLDIPGFEGAGQLQCINVYDSDRPELQNLAPGAIRWARFVTGAFDPSAAEGDDGWPPAGVRRAVLGEAPVEEDGSFFVNVPGNTPFSIELLDANGDVVTAMRAWAWVRSGGQRGCIGCHADPELAPPNVATQALLRMQPTSLDAAKPEGETVPSHGGNDG